MLKKTDKIKLANRLANRLQQIASKPALDEAKYEGAGPNRSRAPRTSTFKPAAITLSGGQRMDVIVKNISDTGARIEFVPQITLPKQVLVAEPTLCIRSWALVIWQSVGAAGLKFIAS